MKRQIYLDYASTTPAADEVIKEMIKHLGFNSVFGNSASDTHDYGQEAKEAIEKARIQVAQIINADASEIVFTSGATESNNLAIKGIASSYKGYGKHIITSQIEHKAVIDICNHLEKDGYKLTYIAPDKKGQISLEKIKKALRDDTILISIMAVNNELGTIYPINDIGKMCAENKIFFHVDAAQGVGKIPIDVKGMNIDLLSISGHKIYAPKGAGALYIKRKKPRIRLTPLIHGGGHEKGLRPGTLATHQIVGLGKACSLINLKRKELNQRLKILRNSFLNQISMLPELIINTPMSNSYAGIINITFKGVDGESLLAMLHQLAVSMGSACQSGSNEASFVLNAIGLTQEEANSSLRFSFGLYTTEEDINVAIREIISGVTKLRGLSPLWKGNHA